MSQKSIPTSSTSTQYPHTMEKDWMEFNETFCQYLFTIEYDVTLLRQGGRGVKISEIELT